uniref:RING-type domain-containing protein n=1 Tax=Strigamia maritima TaxID=126957 RepID=T1J6D0_STRMM
MTNIAQPEINSQVDEFDDTCAVDEELELLRSIYVHEINIKNDENGRPQTVSIDLHPATADKAEEQFVRLNLVFTLPLLYPRDLPEIMLRNSRGISDDDLKKIDTELRKKAEQQKSSQSLYTLIELAKEHLTAKNTPTGICAICLYGFNPKDVFTKTECYHYFHARCLARYVKATLSQKEDGNSKVVCPVCREVIIYELSTLESAPQPVECESAAAFEITRDLRQLQVEMAGLFQRQLSRGGIIDLDAEKNKYLLEISTIVSQEQRSIASDDIAPSVGANAKNESSNESLSADTDTYYGKGNHNKMRGRGKGFSHSNSNRYRSQEGDSAEALAYNSQPELEAQMGQQHRQRPFRSRGRGRGRCSGMSWHQQNRRAKNAEKRDLDDATMINGHQQKEVKNVETPHKSSSTEGKPIKSHNSWGYGPPPLGFSKDANQTSPRNFTRATPIPPPPGFRSRPPFPPRAKPPP